MDELTIIKTLSRFLDTSPGILVGVGDDCAVVRAVDNPRHDWLLTSDAVIQGVHFDPSARPSQIGHKALGRVLSDIAAMGGRPSWALVDLALPRNTSLSFVRGFYHGATSLAEKHGLSIVGGDTAQSKCLQVHVFAVGRVPRDAAVLRSTANAGDDIYVTGTLGGSLSAHHLRFTPRIEQGIWLRKWATAIIDLSDGLATDLRHIARASHVGARIELSDIPVSSMARRMKDKHPPLHHALCDGEDFELLFTVPPGRRKRFLSAWNRKFRLRCSRVGKITRKKGHIECVDCHGRTYAYKGRGYQHFLKAT